MGKLILSTALLFAIGGCSCNHTETVDRSFASTHAVLVNDAYSVGNSKLHLSREAGDTAIWVTQHAESVAITFTLRTDQNVRQLPPFEGMVCDPWNVCPVPCDSGGTCRSGKINPALTFPSKPNDWISYDYSAGPPNGKTADPVIVIHP
jgi:hypothetical protein